MTRVAQSDWYDALLLLGDNVYPEGKVSRLDETVFRPFDPMLAGGTQLFAVLGNHDALAPDGGAEQMGRLGMDGLWWSATLDDVLIVGLDSNHPDDPEQLHWLEATLGSASEKWRIAILHHAPYSAGYHGSSVDARNAFARLFERYGVQLVLSGHKHDYERSVPINGVTYLVSGAGAEFRRTGTEEYTSYSAATVHFLDVNIFDESIYRQAVNNDGQRFDEVTILS
jgi:3',5'-cyclic AMP phosphodiesterase CpdA